MDSPLVMVVRETPSLADSLALLLETVGFRVEPQPSAPLALARLRRTDEEAVRAIVVACNQPGSEMLRGFPDSFPTDARDLPLIVVGGRAAGSRRVWPRNVRFFGLPFEAREFVKLLNELTAWDAGKDSGAIAVEE
jgi:FixJ family two-component response regulator